MGQGVVRVGVLVNPWSGLGGSLGWKGSDDRGRVLAHFGGQLPERAGDRLVRVVSAVQTAVQESAIDLQWVTLAGQLGGQWVAQVGCDYQALAAPRFSHYPEPNDFGEAVLALAATGVDLLVFVGGDGTARLVVDHWPADRPVLGIPAGVKMHSGVYATSIVDAVGVLTGFVQGRLTQLQQQEVRDLDEVRYAKGEIGTTLYGELWVPQLPEALPGTKLASPTNDELVQVEIGAYCVDELDFSGPIIVGPGTTALAVKQALGIEGTLLGVDIIHHGQWVGRDVNEAQLLAVVQAQPCWLILGVTGGQGMVLGRGNQQLSEAVLAHLDPDRWWIVATPNKLRELSGGRLRMDLDDECLKRWSGTSKVLVGYDQWVWVVAH